MKLLPITFLIAAIATGLTIAALAQTVGVKVRYANPVVHHAREKAAHAKVSSVTSGQLPTKQSASPPNISIQDVQMLDKSARLADQGDIEAKNGDWGKAAETYQKALGIWSSNSEALYGLGACAENAGNIPEAIQDYRVAIYSHNPRLYGLVPGDGYQTNDAGRLMEFVLLLSKNGQENEALKAYQRAAYLTNYMDGKQNVDVLLPDYEADRAGYTPQRLQAMAHIGIALAKAGQDDKLALAHLNTAAALAPDSALPYFYRGQHQQKDMGDPIAARKDYGLARQFGNSEVNTSLQKTMQTLP